MKSHKGVGGFSLTELLVVVAVILVLMAILLVGVNTMYTQAMQTKCQHHLEQVGQALTMYTAVSHGSSLAVWEPSTGKNWLQLLCARYVDNPMVLGCPSVGEPPITIQEGTGAQQPVSRDKADDLMKALRWLKSKRNQTTGMWDQQGYGWNQSLNGLALLAFLGFGCTDKHPTEFAETVRKAVENLSSSTAQSSSTGQFTQISDTIYNQGICVMALSAAAQAIEDPGLRSQAAAAAQRGVNWMVGIQSQALYGAFWYNRPYSGAAGELVDTNATCWFYHGLAAARDSGLGVSDSVYTKADEFFYWSYDTAGDAFYWCGMPNSRSGAHSSGYPAATPARLATGLVMGHSPGATDSVTIAEYLYRSNYPTAQLLALEAGTPQKSHTYATYFANEAMVRMGGKYLEKWRQNYFPQRLIAIMNPYTNDMAYWDNNDCCDAGGSQSSRGEWGDVYATCMACMALEAGYTDYWLAVPGSPTIAKASYGYNNSLVGGGRTVAADTIVVMDYEDWVIDRDNIDVTKNHTDADIAARHGGRANILFGDGSVRALRIDQIKPGMWTPQAGD